MPKSATSSQQHSERNTAVPATRPASCVSRRPSARETSVLTPTPVPVPRPIMMFCAGKASDSADRQSSDTIATYTLSTTLYSACTSIESIIGTASVSRSFPSGISPIRRESIFRFIFAITVLSLLRFSRHYTACCPFLQAQSTILLRSDTV